MKRTASAVWNGTLQQGSGTLRSQSGVLSDTPYSFATRFADTPGTNPEELIAAAHAGCFTMALSSALGKAGFTPQRLATDATLTMENLPDRSWTITAVHLEVQARVPGIAEEAFQKVAEGAKVGCPVSRVLNAAITMSARLSS
jgi:osmotically inducible protein OsmC